MQLIGSNSGIAVGQSEGRLQEFRETSTLTASEWNSQLIG
jgi:hypothetical protein